MNYDANKPLNVKEYDKVWSTILGEGKVIDIYSKVYKKIRIKVLFNKDKTAVYDDEGYRLVKTRKQHYKRELYHLN